MIPDLGKYADTVLWAYVVSLLLLTLLVVISLWQARRIRARLEDVEARKEGKQNG